LIKREPVFAVAVDCHEAFIALFQTPPKPHSHLSTELARAGFDQQSGDASFVENSAVERPVRAPAIGDHDIDEFGELFHAQELLANFLALVDYEHADGVAVAPGLGETDVERRDLSS